MPPPTNMARREGVSPRGASVAIADIQGVSLQLSDRLSHVFEQAARAREINLTDAKTAHYLVRGYLSTAPAEGGATFAVIWDVYDANKRRMQRIDDRIFVKGAGPALDGMDESVLNQIAVKSADDLAAVLTNMPEAVAAAASPGVQPASVAGASTAATTVVSGTSPGPATSPPQMTGMGVAAAR